MIWVLAISAIFMAIAIPGSNLLAGMTSKIAPERLSRDALQSR